VSRIGVLGAGSWGTTLADVLVRRGHEVRLWAYEIEVVNSINTRHQNEVFLPGRTLDRRLVAVADPFEAVEGAPIVLSAAPSHVARSVTAPLEPAIAMDAVIVSATKGIESPGLCLPHEVLSATLPGRGRVSRRRCMRASRRRWWRPRSTRWWRRWCRRRSARPASGCTRTTT